MRFNFILPSQAGSAITLDGSIIIIIGVIILGYYLIKNKTLLLEKSPQLNNMENIDDDNKIENITSEKIENRNNNYNQTKIQRNTGNDNEIMEEDYVKNHEKEVIFNRR